MRYTGPMLIACLPFIPLQPTFAAEPVDLEMVTKIRDEGFRRSQVMDTLYQLTDVIGPRLTNSPQQRAAAEWTRQKLEEWGLRNAQLEPWGEFGRGWSFSRCAVHMIRPHAMPLIALPKAWTPGTNGAVRGTAMRITLNNDSDLEKNKGKLAGKVLMLNPPRDIPRDEEAFFRRLSEEQLEDLEDYPIPGARSGPGGDGRAQAIRRWEFRKKLNDFLIEEGVVALIELSSRNAGVVRLGGSGVYGVDENPGPSALAMAAEHYNRILRHLDKGEEVELEIDVAAQFHDEDLTAYNVIAEIPSRIRPAEVVMLGGHLDSWHPGTGATDNAAGVAVAMEAVRILKALDVRPRRTIRLALWTGEEQGLLGSRGYVEKHFASRPEPTDPEELKLPRSLRTVTWPLRTTREHRTFSAYFNLDNGSGKIRGIYCQDNAAVAPIFEAWLKPLHDLGADTVTLRNTGATDHVSFDAVGLPGFQFIQDPLDYFTRTHHTNMDVYDRLQREDLVQASIVMAVFVYHAAMRDELLPRKPMPRERADDAGPERPQEAVNQN